MKIFWLIPSIVCLCIAAQTEAKNFYISTAGNDSNNGLTVDTPWKSLDKLYNSWGGIGPGDSVLFRRGDLFAPATVGTRTGLLRIPNKKKGTAAAPITLGAYGVGERPVISGENCGDSHQVFRTGALEYITVQDLEFRGNVIFRAVDDQTMGIRNLRLLRIKLQGGIDTGNQTKISFYNPYAPSLVPLTNVAAPIDNVEIGYCEFYDTEGEDAVNIGSVGDSLWVHHNIWKNVSEEALDVAGGTGHVIEYNFVSGCSVNGIKFHSQYSKQYGIVIRGNLILHAGLSATALVLQNISDSKVYNNTVVSSYTCGFGNRDRTAPEAYYGDFTGNEIFNNIFMGVVQITGYWQNADLGAGPWYSAPVFNIWKNNSFHHNYYWSYYGNTVMRFWEGQPYPGTTGILNRSRTVETTNPGKFVSEWQGKADPTELMSNPQFTAPAWDSPYQYGNFTPSETSPVLNAGVPVQGYTHDIAGVPVPADTNPSIGAYQMHLISHGNVRDLDKQPLRNFPNPFFERTTIEYTLKECSDINLLIYDLSGQVVFSLSEKTKPPGTISISWNSRDNYGNLCPAGLYFYRLVAGGDLRSGKMVLMR